MPLVRLTVLRGKDAGQVRRFRMESGDQVVIGRHEDCDLPLWDESASRRHALLEISGGALRIVDLGSSNGLYVNGVAKERASLTGGERIRIGETEVRVETEGFQKRETVVLTAGAEYTVESALAPDELDLGASLVTDASMRARFDQLLVLVDRVQAAETGEEILSTLLGLATESLDALGLVVPCTDSSTEPLWSEAQRTPGGTKVSRLADSIVDQVLREGNALQISDTRENPLTRTRESIVSRGVTSIIAAPIAGRGSTLGAIYLEGKGDRTYTEDDLAYVGTLAKIAGMALLAAERLQASRRIVRRQNRDVAAEIVTQSPALQTSLEHLARFAGSGGPVLIAGETGTGKELLARAAHRHGPYGDGPFIAVNCAAIPASLLESELFGHEKGAFTGAIARKSGMFELANEGTLFLDEIGELPHELQPKLLRVLETGEFFRIGGRAPVSVRLLVVSATNRDLEQASREGTFREDLFFRLNRFRVHSIALRERPEDIEPLALHFLDLASKRAGTPKGQLSPEATRVLTGYRWPGNIRELRNVVERAAVVAHDGVIRPNDLLLSSSLAAGPQAISSDSLEPKSIDQVEEEAIRIALHHTGGKKGEAAEILGIAWPTLRRKLRKYGIDADDPLERS
ncbi:MAG: sigma 54-interacting transcriptional regulator [Planctomycetes bacterium]|nr:sigma 54-interacting transcriptional regulator [Planctomycetota bacterium]